MMLIDTGPLVALVDKDDAHHDRCRAIIRTLPPLPVVTTLPCLTEAMYLLGKVGGLIPQQALWRMCLRGTVAVHVSAQAELARMSELMTRYRDAPMDFADASLVAAAEALKLKRVFTLDRHFYAYIPSDGVAFEVIG